MRLSKCDGCGKIEPSPERQTVPEGWFDFSICQQNGVGDEDHFLRGVYACRPECAVQAVAASVEEYLTRQKGDR